MNYQIATIGLVIACAVAAAGAETFEGDTVHHWTLDNERDVKLAWSNYSSPNTTGEFTWMPDAGRGGSGALRMTANGPKTSLWQVAVPVVGGATYQFSAWVKVQDGRGTTYLSGRFKDEDNAWVSGGNFSSKNNDVFLRGTTEWRRLEVHFKAPAAAKKTTLFLANRFGEGDTVWFDDVKLKEAVGPQLRRDGPGIAADIGGAVARLRAMGAVLPDAVTEQARQYPQRIAERVAALEQSQSDIDARLAAWSALSEGVQLRRQLRRRAQFRTLALSAGDAPLAGTWVSSMQRVFIDDLPLPDDHQANGQLTLFRGEREAAQLVLVPFESRKDVSVRITRSGTEGAARALSADDIDWKVVGYVKIDEPAYNHRRTEPFPYTGWWPDPLLDKPAFDLDAQHFQPIWIQAHAPRDVAPGTYDFRVEVVSNGNDGASRVLARSPLRVQVRDAALPKQWHMRKVMSFASRLARESGWSGADKQYVAYGERWPEVQDAFYQMLVDYRIGIGTSFYQPIDTYPMDWLKRAEAAGQNVFFTAAGRARYNDEGDIVLSMKDRSRINRTLGPVADQLAEHGLLAKTYYYGFDEQWPWFFDLANDVFTRAKQTGYRTMSTLHDESYGTDSVLSSSLDVYVDSQNDYDPQLADKARAEGRDVWVYTTGDFNIETDAIYHRLRPWKVMNLKAGGYLIWCMNRWVGNDKFIGDKVRSDWNPRLDGVTPHSSAMMIYPGKDGPVSCIRLENFRDGIEDYDLLAHEAARAQRDNESPREAQVRLLRALDAPDDLNAVNPAELRAMRARLAERIGERSPSE